MNHQQILLQILCDAEGHSMTLATLRSDFRNRAGRPISEGDARTALREIKGRGWATEGKNPFDDQTWKATPEGHAALEG